MDAADLPQDLVFVDLETTGGNAAYHRITEVGIVRMHAGVVIEEWNSLVNPECPIPAYIAAFTGITDTMVAQAPRFADIASLVLEKLRGPVFVAHNARFDYAFLRTEFRRLDMNFSAPVLCTVKLSRRLFPQFPRHSLDAVMERHQLTCTARHRALGDAQVLSAFWSKLLDEVSVESLAAAARAVTGANKLPAHFPAGLADELPEGPGVYRFFGENDELLYIGKSHSLRARILGHFTHEQTEAKEQKKARQTRRMDWLETAGVLGAQLKEAEWIKTQRPAYNKRVKSGNDSVTMRLPALGVREQEARPPRLGGFGAKEPERAPDAQTQAARTPDTPMRGAQSQLVRFVAIDGVQPQELAECFGLFHSHKDARKALTDIARAHSLCLKVLGLEEGSGACVGYAMLKCRGACVGREPLLLHNMRVRMALSALKLKAWPFPGRIALKEGHGEFHVLDHWAYLGTARSEEELTELAGVATEGAFDAEIYRILVRHLAKNPKVEWHDVRTETAL
jgi:DNA polymerase-3 subunit epsilon